MTVRWVVFDVGETLFSERRLYNAWADWLSVDRSMFWAVLMDTILTGRDHREVFAVFRDGFDLAKEREARAAVGQPDVLQIKDIYPDAVEAISDISAMGIQVGIAGNQPASTSTLLRTLDAPIELIGTSEQWRLKKPDAAFFERILSLTNAAAHEIAYVGDRMDNDILPAQAVGMVGVFLRRGPWALAQGDRETKADHVIDGLAELAGLLR